MAKSTPTDNVDLKEKQRYVQGYLQVVSNLYGRRAFSQEQARIAERAWKQRLPPSAFVSMIRRQDPAYARTPDFGKRQKEAREVWGQMRPGRPMNNEFASKYVHSHLSKTQLLSRIQYGMNKKMLMPPSTNANAYRTMRSLLNDSFRRQTGQDANPLLHDLVFSTKKQESHIDEQYHELFGGKDVFKWMESSPKPSTQQNQFGIDALKVR